MVSTSQEMMQMVYLTAGRRVTVASWYDAHRHLWRASAPAYSWLYFARPGVSTPGFTSRDAAILHLLRLFDGFFLERSPDRRPLPNTAAYPYTTPQTFSLSSTGADDGQ